MFKFRGFLNIFTDEGNIQVLRNTIRDAGSHKVATQVIAIKKREMVSLVKKAKKNGHMLTVADIYQETIEKHPLWKMFFETELHIEDTVWKQLAASINHSS